MGLYTACRSTAAHLPSRSTLPFASGTKSSRTSRDAGEGRTGPIRPRRLRPCRASCADPPVGGSSRPRRAVEVRLALERPKSSVAHAERRAVARTGSDGSVQPARVNDELVAGEVRNDFVALADGGVLYVAYQELGFSARRTNPRCAVADAGPAGSTAVTLARGPGQCSSCLGPITCTTLPTRDEDGAARTRREPAPPLPAPARGAARR